MCDLLENIWLSFGSSGLVNFCVPVGFLSGSSQVLVGLLLFYCWGLILFRWVSCRILDRFLLSSCRVSCGLFGSCSGSRLLLRRLGRWPWWPVSLNYSLKVSQESLNPLSNPLVTHVLKSLNESLNPLAYPLTNPLKSLHESLSKSLNPLAYPLTNPPKSLNESLSNSSIP